MAMRPLTPSAPPPERSTPATCGPRLSAPDMKRGSTAGRAQERIAELLSRPPARTPSASRAKALHAAGWLASQQGDYAEARALFEESLAICRELGDARGRGWALVDLGFLKRYQGD